MMMMSRISLLLLTAILAASQACAKQGSTQAAESKAGSSQGADAKSDAKHGKAKLEWLNGAEIEKATKLAQKEDKKIFLEFTGSDWCPPCIQLKRNVFVTKEFASYAKANLVLVKLDFPRSKKLPDKISQANTKLQKKFGVRALPTIVLLNKEGKTLGRSEGYSGAGPEAFIKKLEGMARKKPAEEKAKL